jgi:ABC-type lipoprotein release transport system permease subunit
LLAYAAARWLESLLAGLKPADALTFATATALCFVATLLGTIVPALRAIRTDPSRVMRVE